MRSAPHEEQEESVLIGNGSTKYWLGAAATIIAALVTALVVTLARGGTVPNSGSMPVEFWQEQFRNVRDGIGQNQTLLRTIESHAQLQTQYMNAQTDLLKEIRDELRRREHGK